MKLQTLGHASLSIHDSNGPLLLTDPWLTGSCYWRSWWLQNYPTQQTLEGLRSTRYCYVTHTHPDHFHTASIRKLGTKPLYLCPTLPQERIAGFLRQQGEWAARSGDGIWRQPMHVGQGAWYTFDLRA